MRKISILPAFLIIILFTYSCVKDHSPLEIDKLNEVTIKGISDTVIVSMGDTLKINPVLEMSGNTNTSYDYLWYSFTTNMQFSADTLSKEKNIAAPIKLVPGTYSLVFRVMDRNTGIFYKSTVSL
ncbi:MAG: PKD-like family lipoprotein, partial [Ginsengibacter sp.]